MKSSAQPSTITVHVPMTFAIRGGRKMIISDVAQASDKVPHAFYNAGDALHTSIKTPRQRTDNALQKALARAHRWRRMIETGEYASITEMARSEKVNESYACRVLRLTLLAPTIVTAILNGRHGPDVILRQLVRPFPVRWDQQIVAFQIDHYTQNPSRSAFRGYEVSHRTLK